MMHTQPPPLPDDRKHRVLILKMGYSETLDPDTSGVVSLGDILRTTSVLHAFPPDKYEVTWLADKKGIGLLKGNPYIHRILTVNPFTPYHLMSDWFDIVVNFEKDPGICAMADKISAWRRYGFRFDHVTHEAHAYDNSDQALSMSKSMSFKREQTKSWSTVLYEMIGLQYNHESYILGYQPKSQEVYDIGLNHQVGGKFPIKRWPDPNWHQLNDTLASEYSFSWQQGMDNIESYIEWINSCRLIITNDSLGLHIGLALRKKVVALFGPTKANEVDECDCLIKLTPDVGWDCIPCLSATCDNAQGLCMDHISQDRVIEAVKKLLSQS
jgi:heptosyltransferase-2